MGKDISRSPKEIQASSGDREGKGQGQISDLSRYWATHPERTKRAYTAEEEKYADDIFKFESDAEDSDDKDRHLSKRPRLIKGDTTSPTQQDSPSSSHEQPRQEAGPSSSTGEPTAGHDRLLQAIRDEQEASTQRDEARIRYDETMKDVRSKLETLIQQKKDSIQVPSNELNYTGAIGSLQQVKLIREYHISPEIQGSSPDADFNLLSLRELALGRQSARDNRSNSNNFVRAWDILAYIHPDKLRNILGRANNS